MQPQTLINGHAEQLIASDDRGLAYGHGLFETLLVIDGRPVFWHEHLQRLLRGCSRLGIPVDGLPLRLEQDLQQLQFSAGRAVLKILLTCGSGGRGYQTPQPAVPRRLLMATPMPVWPDRPEQGIRARWCDTRLACQPRLAGIKHLNRLEQVLARNEWQDPRIREGLVCDSRGFVVEGTMSNLCFLRGRQLCTPALDQCGVEGIVRNQLIELAAELGLHVQIGHYTPDEVAAADELLVCNSLIGIWPITRLGAHRYPHGPITRQLQSALEQRMMQC